jgi:hypothetical protein
LQMLFESHFVLGQPLSKRMRCIGIGMNQSGRARLVHRPTERSTHRVNQGLFALGTCVGQRNAQHTQRKYSHRLSHIAAKQAAPTPHKVLNTRPACEA